LLDWLDLPENKELKNNTIVLFTSDNGGIVHEVPVSDPKRSVTSNRPLRGGKTNTYEGGTRVPWIVRWPGKISEGSVCSEPVSTIDIYPTLLELTGNSAKEDQILDGQSIVLLLEGESMSERPIFWDFQHNFGPLCASSSTVRLGDYKLLRFHWAGENAASHYYELFDLKKDPSEAINLAAYMPEKLKELAELISQHLEQTNAIVPIPNSEFSGNPRTPRSQLNKALIRPISYSLPQSIIVPEEDKGNRILQLLDQNGDHCHTSALVIEGSEWIQVENLPGGQAKLTWDRSLKSVQAKVLLGWSGGTTAHEMNDWTMDPYELVID